MVALKYLDFKKDVDPNVHVRMFNFVIKENAKTFEEYIINAFNYTLRDMTLDWCHNYMSEFPSCIFSKLTHAFCKCHSKT
jgi:plasmid replication initiation protein